MNTNDFTRSAYKVNKSFEVLTLTQVLEATEMKDEPITNKGLFNFARGIRALSLSEDMEFTRNQLKKFFDRWYYRQRFGYISTIVSN